MQYSSSFDHSHSSRRVLIVEQDQTLRTLYQKILQLDNLVMFGVSSGEEALASLSAFQPNLILTALNLPGISGFELSRNVRLLEQGDPVIIVSLSPCDDHATIIRLHDTGIDIPLTIPIDLHKLRSIVQQGLRLHNLYSLLSSEYSRMLFSPQQAQFNRVVPLTQCSELRELRHY